MKLLFAIAHFYGPQPVAKYSSQAPDPRPRIVALTACISAVHQLFSSSQYLLQISPPCAIPANQRQHHDLDVVVCTTRGQHLLGQLPLPPSLYRHHPTDVEPLMLGFEAQDVLRDGLGKFDYYCYLEDDLVLQDAWFFRKLAWFNGLGDDRSPRQRPPDVRESQLCAEHTITLHRASAAPIGGSARGY
jgi:hypothetical protein